MQEINKNEIIKNPYKKGAITRKDFSGFYDDYLVLHCLIKKFKPKTFLEIGTSAGTGTNIICNAMGLKRFNFLSKYSIKVYSIDVPPGTDPSIIYPNKEDGHPKIAGLNCKFPYKQLFGNSQMFDFEPYYPLEGWFIDGKHSNEFVKIDTIQALKSNPKIIIWHDTDIPEVLNAINDILKNKIDFNLFKIPNTRISFALKI